MTQSSTTTESSTRQYGWGILKGRPWFLQEDRLPGLCSQCSRMGFDQFSSPSTPTMNNLPPTRMLISLFTVIKNYQGVECSFCTLLFDALALERHDPFEHPAVKEYMPVDTKDKNFKSWATHIDWSDRFLRKPHPFGQSRNKVIIEENPENLDELREHRDGSQEVLQGAAVFAGGAAVGATAGAAAREANSGRRAGLLVGSGAGTLAAVFQGKDNKLPVVLWIKMHRAGTVDAGLIQVSLWGYGNKAQAPLSRLSSFNLRIALDGNSKDDNSEDDNSEDDNSEDDNSEDDNSEDDKSKDGILEDGEGGLVYGKIVGNTVDVRTTCRRWLQNCRDNHHGLCAEPQWSASLDPPSTENFRLIEIGEPIVCNRGPQTAAHDENDERLRREYACKIVTMTSVPEYAALSYVWGETGEKSLNLHMGNLHRLSSGINNQEREVARTISDAIAVAKDLGFQYLWVDSLCVIQQNGNNAEERTSREARESQLMQMDRIFAHATVVLVAAAGRDASAGLVGVSKTREPNQTARKIIPNVNVLLPLGYDRTYGKWDTRGWTLQEKLLSKRLLVFGQNYVSFHCRHGIQREDMPAAHAGESAGPPPIPYLSAPSATPGSRQSVAWNGNPVILRSPYFTELAKLIEQYTSRQMSKSSDIIVGISGLLKVMDSMRSRETQGHHTLYGLPEEFLDLALLWQPPAVDKTHLAKRADASFPSWSWAGWEVRTDPRDGHDDQSVERSHGVRFEEPFWVSGNDNLSLKKFRADGPKAEERYKPLVMWFKFVQHSPIPPPRLGTCRLLPDATPHYWGQLVPVNGCGLGVMFDSSDAHLRALQKVLRFRGLRLREDDFQAAEAPYVDPEIPLEDRHLVCETQIATFSLQRKPLRIEPLWHVVDGVAKIEKELEIWEVEILDRDCNVVGHVIPTDQRETIPTESCDFVLLSESQYWGNEKRVDIVGYPLYNVMLVEWDSNGWFATRTGLGKISKQAWDAAEPRRKRVILK